MFQETQQGRFWLPDRPERDLDGTLDVDDRGTLKLSLREGLLGLGEHERTPRTIQGAITGNLVTLVARRISYSGISYRKYLPDEHPEVWRCEQAFIGGSHESHLGEHIVGVEVQMQSLPDWANEGRDLNLDWQKGVLSWSPEYSGPAGQWLMGDIRVQHTTRPAASRGSGRPYTITVASTTSFVVKFSQPQPLTTVVDTVSSLQTLVSVAMGESVGVERVVMIIDADHSDERVLFHYEPVLRPVDPANKNSELFTMSELGGIEGVGKWLDCLRDQTHFKNGLLADRYRRPVFVTDQTSHLLMAGEAYERHTRGRSKGKMDVHKTLRPALKVAGHEFLEWTGDQEKWMKKVNDIRIEQVAHLENYGNTTSDSLDALLVNHQLYILLVTRILAQCGLSEEALNRVVGRARAEAIVRLH